jgi:enoyl-CoA hydratase/carnithine racemase
MSADDAFKWGLVNEVVAPEELEAAVGKLIKKIVEKSPLMIRWVKETVNLVLDHDLLSGIDKELTQFSKTFNTYDSKEGTTAFLEKRKPKFIGK